MTTGNDPALKPDDGQSAQQTENQQQTGAQPQADGGKGPGLTFTDPQPEQDADEITLQTLEAAAQAEEAGTANGQQQGTGDVKDPAHQAQTNGQQGQPQAQNGQQPPAGDERFIPKPRFDQVLSERDQLREQNAYLRGQTEALQHRSAPAQPPGQQQQPPTHEQRLADLKTQRTALATQFDNGEITAADWENKRSALDDAQQAIREEQLAAKLKPATAPAAPPSDTLYLDQLTEKLETAHPWVGVFDQFAKQSGSEAEWDYLTNMARSNLAARGVDLRNGGDNAKYELRKEIAEMADKYGPALLGDRAKALGIALPGSQQPPNGQQQPQPLSPQAQARKTALEKAGNAPPDLAALNGNAGDPTGVMTEARMETLAEDDYDKMPAAVRNKLLGVSP